MWVSQLFAARRSSWDRRCKTHGSVSAALLPGELAGHQGTPRSPRVTFVPKTSLSAFPLNQLSMRLVTIK